MVAVSLESVRPRHDLSLDRIRAVEDRAKPRLGKAFMSLICRYLPPPPPHRHRKFRFLHANTFINISYVNEILSLLTYTPRIAIVAQAMDREINSLRVTSRLRGVGVV